MTDLISFQNLLRGTLLEKESFSNKKAIGSARENVPTGVEKSGQNPEKLQGFFKKILGNEKVSQELIQAMQPSTIVIAIHLCRGFSCGFLTKESEVKLIDNPLSQEDIKFFVDDMIEASDFLFKGDKNEILKKFEQVHNDLTHGILFWATDRTTSAGFLLRIIGEVCAQKGLSRYSDMMHALSCKLIDDSTHLPTLQEVELELEETNKDLEILKKKNESDELEGSDYSKLIRLSNHNKEYEAKKNRLEILSSIMEKAIESASLQDLEDDESYQWALSALGVPPYEESQEKVGVQTKMRVRLLG